MSDLTNSKAVVTEYFGEWIDGINQRDDLKKVSKTLLKKNEEYQKLLKERKSISNRIKDIEEGLESNIEIKRINENISMLKESVSEELDCKKNIVAKLFSFYKKKLESNVDELQEIATQWVELFEGDK